MYMETIKQPQCDLSEVRSSGSNASEKKYIERSLEKLGFDDPYVVESVQDEVVAYYFFSELEINGYRPLIVRCYSSLGHRDWYIGSVPDSVFKEHVYFDDARLVDEADGFLLPSDPDKVAFRLMVEFFEYNKRAAMGYHKAKKEEVLFTEIPDTSIGAQEVSFGKSALRSFD